MIQVRARPGAPVEEMDLAEFERRAREGEIAPQHEVCFPAVTGDTFVAARELELFRGLYAAGAITFKRYFNLGRVPYLTLALMGLLLLSFLKWQGAADGRLPFSDNDLLAKGAKSGPLIVELGQWWRLLTANLLHGSWVHLIGNLVFLLNLGGAAEAVFRRLDYLLVIVASALGSALLSTAVNPAPSFGASGIVFGVWGAAAVFGVRHRDLLPPRYRRYFIGSVIPYSIFALYLGLAVPGVDNWAHLGGLLSGSAVAVFLPARLLHPRDDAAPTKILVLAVAALGLAAGALLPLGPGPLQEGRVWGKLGAQISVPQRWRLVDSQRTTSHERWVFANSAGVSVSLVARRRDQPTSLSALRRAFIDHDLAKELEAERVEGLRILGPTQLQVDGFEGAELQAHFALPAGRGRMDFLEVRSDFLLVARGHHHYLLSTTAPAWLHSHYASTFAAIKRSLRLIDPEDLRQARHGVQERDSAAARATLALALAKVGDWREAREHLRAAGLRWPQAGELKAAEARLLFERRAELGTACLRIREAMESMEWNAGLVAFAAEVHVACNEPRVAHELLVAGLQRFPGAVELHRIRANLESPGEP